MFRIRNEAFFSKKVKQSGTAYSRLCGIIPAEAVLFLTEKLRIAVVAYCMKV
jgi:hypothetical protein